MTELLDRQTEREREREREREARISSHATDILGSFILRFSYRFEQISKLEGIFFIHCRINL